MRRFVASSRRHDRRKKLGPFVLWPIAYYTPTNLSGTNPAPVSLVNENYVYPSLPTDNTYIYWDGPSDNGVSWYGFFGDITNGPAIIDRIDVWVRGYITKSAGQIVVWFGLDTAFGEPLYSIGQFTGTGATQDAWEGGTILGRWPIERFRNPASAADYTRGPYIGIMLNYPGTGNKDMYIKNVQIHLYGH